MQFTARVTEVRRTFVYEYQNKTDENPKGTYGPNYAKPITWVTFERVDLASLPNGGRGTGFSLACDDPDFTLPFEPDSELQRAQLATVTVNPAE
jgi:hypothetical protein